MASRNIVIKNNTRSFKPRSHFARYLPELGVASSEELEVNQ